ncbi:aspartate/glutamate ABC transporter permease [Streptococcus pneumoniae]|nr:aspartate/glutamate ABC transporter permease [Streptococcus pneumoniae]VOA53868.1 aspartate/glutamate ABC transporter permease [Streptococcus pneumoniae]VOA82542.1 aspartate/glutamate ABC transporter permease [Streptococcus pneumoniae]
MIKISNLSKSFSGQTVLDHLNIESLGRFIERKMAISAPDTVQTDVKGDLR